MNNTIDDIKQLPDLFKRKEHLEDQIKKLDEQKAALKNEIESEKTKAEETLRTFDATIAAYKKASMEWWKQFYIENSAEIVQTSILSLLAKQTKDQKDLDESQKIASDEFIHKIDEAKRAYEDNKALQQKFAQSAGTIAQKAMCYDVCIYIDRSKYTIKKFNDTRDWGLHLRPKGVGVSIFKYIFMLTNPFGYMDLDKAVRNLPSLYRKLLDSKKRLQDIISQNNIRDINNPVGELNRRLSTAKETIAKKNKEIESTKQQILDLQKLMALVGNGKMKFLEQWFSRHSFLNKQKEKYIADMSSSLSRLPDYPSMKLVYDELLQNVFDFKDADSYVENERKQIEASYATTVEVLMQKSWEAESQKGIASQALEDVRKDIKDLRDNYENVLVEMTKNDPASTFFYQSKGWINKVDAEGHNSAVERIKEMASSRNKLEHLPVFEYLNLGGVEEPFLSEIDWQTGIDKAVNLVVKPLREDINKPDARLWAASNLITTILLSLPIRKVHFTFIDFDANSIFDKILSEIDKRHTLYSIVYSTSQLTKIVEDYFNKKSVQKTDKTEVIVWSDMFGKNSERIQEISAILKNGATRGYYVIAVPISAPADDNLKVKMEQIFKENNFKEVYAPGDDFNSGRGSFIKALEHYIQDDTAKDKIDSVYQDNMQDGSIFINCSSDSIKKSIKIPIGVEVNDRQTQAFWELNVNSQEYLHTFLLGGTGSGKSYFLHNVILNLMLKYKPEELELYLMDFKDGGVEFQNYEHLPHVSHLLIDNTDRQVVYEIMVALRENMEVQAKTIRDAKLTNIVEYNEITPNKKLPYVILIVDECDKLFSSDNTEAHLQNKIDEIISTIATQGRAFGFVFFFATQTLTGWGGPAQSKVLSIAPNRYLMHVMSDNEANGLINNGSLRNQDLSTGYAYHNITNTFIQTFNYKGRKWEKDYRERAIEVLKQVKRPEKRNDFVSKGTVEEDRPTLVEHRETPCLFIGLPVGVHREVENHVRVEFEDTNGNNVLITGVNNELQTERIFFNALLTLAEQHLTDERRIRISVIDNTSHVNNAYSNTRDKIFNLLSKNENVKVLRTDRDILLEMARLSELVRKEPSELSKEETKDINVVFILAQERMRRLLKREIPIVSNEKKMNTNSEPVNTESPVERAKRRMAIGFDQTTKTPAFQHSATISAPQPSGRMLQDELMFLLREGGEKNIHVVMQVTQPGDIFTDPRLVTSTNICDIFSDFIMLRCSQEAMQKLPNTNIRIDRLCEKNERLRGVHHQQYGITELFIPYMFPNK